MKLYCSDNHLGKTLNFFGQSWKMLRKNATHYLYADESDDELDKWNEDDERKQEEGDSEVDGEDEEDKKAKNDFLDDEADESDNDDDFVNGRDDIDSGSEGDVSDDGENDNTADENSVLSDSEFSVLKSHHSMKKKPKQTEESTIHPKEETMDLFGFGDSRSRGPENGGSLENNSNSEKGTGESVESLCLRLDSLEDGDDTNFHFPSSPLLSKMKAKSKNVANISEASQESSQSSFGGGLGSEFGGNANSLEASSDSNVIPPGQGDNRVLGMDEDRSPGKKTPEIFSSFSRVRHLMGMGNYGDALSVKKVIILIYFKLLLLGLKTVNLAQMCFYSSNREQRHG